MQKKIQKATLKSIGAELGITHTTVSNAFNRPEKISKELRKKILAHAQSVGYYGPNQAAKSLRTGKSGSIGVIFNDQLSYAFTDPYDISFLQGVSTVCERNGLNIVLIPLKNKDQNTYDPLTAIVDGYILNAPYKNNPTTQEALTKGIPVTVVDFDAPGHININNDDVKLMHDLTEHLLSLGHKNIAIITFGLQEEHLRSYHLDIEIESDNFVVKQRLSGCQQALKNHNLDLSKVIVKEAENSESGGAKASQLLLAEHPEITAFICFSDRLAYGAMQFCSDNDISVPQQISVTGFDGINKPSFAKSLPSLTTIKQNPFQKGQKATQALLDQAINGNADVTVDAEFIISESTAKAPHK